MKKRYWYTYWIRIAHFVRFTNLPQELDDAVNYYIDNKIYLKKDLPKRYRKVNRPASPELFRIYHWERTEQMYNKLNRLAELLETSVVNILDASIIDYFERIAA